MSNLENSTYDKELMTLYLDCKKEYPNVPDIALLIECQRYLKNPNQRTNKHNKHILNRMKKEHEERVKQEKEKWLNNDTYLGVSVKETPDEVPPSNIKMIEEEIPISNVAIED